MENVPLILNLLFVYDRDVGSQYFPDAPPVYSDPVGFLSYLFSKMYDFFFPPLFKKIIYLISFDQI